MGNLFWSKIIFFFSPFKNFNRSNTQFKDARFDSFTEEQLYVIHQAGSPCRENCARRLGYHAVLKTKDTVLPDKDQPKLVDNIFTLFLNLTKKTEVRQIK